MTSSTPASPAVVEHGHPPGLYMLFFAEMWERFCFYGMRALLTLYMTKHFLYSDEQANGVYGSYNSLVYLSPILGGFLAQKFLGFRAAIILGGIIMAIGEFVLVVQREFFFYAGMATIIFGNGLFKPNISTLVGTLYREGDPRRDSGFTIFYMGINIGALASTLICGYIGENYGWTYGFAIAGVGILLGVATFAGGRKLLMGNGEPPDPQALPRNVAMTIALGIVLIPITYFLLREVAIVRWMLGITIAFVIGLLFVTALREEHTQRERMFVLIVLWFFHALFWAFFEQAGSSLTLFTDRNVELTMAGWKMPTSWGQFFNPAFILVFGTVFTLLWTKLGRMGRDPSIPNKFALGLVQLGLGYGVLVIGAQFAGPDAMLPLIFLVLCYLLHTTGELCLSPIGLSAVTKLAPKRMTGIVMGAWFLSISFGHTIAAWIASLTGDAGKVEGDASQSLPIYIDIYLTMAWVSVGAGVLLFLLSPVLKRWLHGVK